MAAKRNVEKNFYVSWIAVENDPWNAWLTSTKRDGTPLAFRADDDPEWPGVPEEFVDGEYLIDTGPTLATLFHSKSRFCNLKDIDRVYLLYQKELDSSPHDKLKEAIEKIAAARGRKVDCRKIEYVPVEGVNPPTNHEQIVEALRGWITGSKDPFKSTREVRKGQRPRRICVNLSPGTPAMHASWLILKWNGTLGDGPETFVEFIQGDGGVKSRGYCKESERQPVIDVPFDTLSRLIATDTKHPVERDEYHIKGILLDDLVSRPYKELREMIDKAALLGLPIVLEGDRGTGKTILAQHYHERRQFYRRIIDPAKAATDNKKIRVPNSTGEFVNITVSEFNNVQEMRDTLFGWAKGSWNLAADDNLGLLGKAHAGTLFLDEIHHLDKSLQSLLLGPMNSGRYRPKMADWEVISDFDLVVASNRGANWEENLAEDFRDRIKRIVLHVPSFVEVKKSDPGCGDIWTFWTHTFQRRCNECAVHYEEPPGDCEKELQDFLKHSRLPGNWRDLHRLADQILLRIVAARDGRPTSPTWTIQALKEAISATDV